MAKRSSPKFVCPDCGFVAKHAMGLGRHRSARHGVVSQRKAKQTARAGWLTREQAAAYAKVHYNTIRGWERTGLLVATKRPGVRGTLVSTADLDKLLAERAAPGRAVVAGAGADAAAVRALEQKFDDLVAGLERLISGLRGSGGSARARATSAAKAPAAARKSTKPRGRKSPRAAAKRAKPAPRGRKAPARRAPARKARARRAPARKASAAGRPRAARARAKKTTRTRARKR